MHKNLQEWRTGLLRVLRLNHDFGLNISVLATGTLVAQLVYILSSPVLSRLYSPAEFGALAAFTALVTSTAAFAALRYDLAVMLPKQSEEAINLVSLSVIISLSTTLILGLTGILFRGKIASLTQVTEFSVWMVFFPLGVLSLCVAQIFRMWWYRQNRFKISAASAVIQAVFDTVVKVGAAALLHAGSMGLLMGYLLGIIAADVLLLSAVQYTGANGLLRSTSAGKMVSMGKRFKTFSLYNSWADLICSFSLNLPTLLLTFLFSPFVAGLYMMANRVLKVPTRILGLSISQALFKEITRRRNETLPIFPFLAKFFCVLLVLVAVPFTLFALSSRVLFGAIFGPGWERSGEYAGAMVPWIAMQFVSLSVSAAYPALEKSGKYAVVQFLLLLGATCPLLISYRLGLDALQSIRMLSMTNFVLNALFGIGALFICYRQDAGLTQAPPSKLLNRTSSLP
jgi:O-antigen/teichoic acid export membrane protein